MRSLTDEKTLSRARRPHERTTNCDDNFKRSEARVDVRPFIGRSRVKEPAGGKMVAAISGAAAAFGGHVRCVRAGQARAMHADAQRAQATEHVRNGPPADRC